MLGGGLTGHGGGAEGLSVGLRPPLPAPLPGRGPAHCRHQGLRYSAAIHTSTNPASLNFLLRAGEEDLKQKAGDHSTADRRQVCFCALISVWAAVRTTAEPHS